MASALHGSELLDRFLRLHKLSERALAAKVGVHYSRISRYRNGESIPGTATAARLERETRGRVPLLAWLRPKPS